MPNLVAFELLEDHRDTFLGGVIRVTDTRSVDVADLLRDEPDADLNPEHVIVVDADDDLALVVALDGFTFLRRTDVPEQAGDEPAKPLDEYTVPELKAKLDDLGATYDKRATKPELLALLASITNHQEG